MHTSHEEKKILPVHKFESKILMFLGDEKI